MSPISRAPLLLAVSLLLSLQSVSGARFFPDLALRFPVGDTEARNPNVSESRERDLCHEFAGARVITPDGIGPRAFRIAYLDEKLVNGLPPPGATLDLIVANRDSSSLDIFVSDGGINFKAPYSLRAGNSPRDIAARHEQLE